VEAHLAIYEDMILNLRAKTLTFCMVNIVKY